MSGSDYWRARAGLSAVKGVVATEAGLNPHAPDADEPVRLRRIPAEASVAALVRHYWVPRWRLPPGTVVDQAVLEYPAANIVVDAHTAALHGAHVGLASRRLAGEGWAVGALLQVGVAHAIVPDVGALVGASVPLGRLGLPGTQRMIAGVRAHAAAGDDAAAAAVLGRWIGEAGIRLDPDARLIASVVDAVESDRSLLRVEDLAARFGLGVRALQRRTRDQLGFTPKWLIQRYRMQEAAYAVSDPDGPPLAELAAALGFADQAHFTRVFRAVIGSTPAEHARNAHG